MPGVREVGIAVVDVRALVLQELDELVRRRLAVVIDVLLVGEAEHEDAGALDALAGVVERVGHLADDVPRHAGVDLAGQFDEPRPHAVLGRLPRQVEGVERDAVAAEAGARVERRESERLGLGRLDHFPDVDPHPVEGDLELVDERDVDRPEDVLEQLAGLGHTGRRHRDHLVHARGIQRHGRLGGRRVDAADDLRDGLGVEVRVARILALGREGEQEVVGARQAGRLEQRQHFLVGRARIGGRLEHDQLALAQARGNRLGRVVDVRQVGFAVGAERRRDADENRVALRQAVEVRGHREPTAVDGRLDPVRADVPNVGLAARQGVDLLCVDVQPEHAEARLLEHEGEGESDVALPDDADDRRAVLDA